MEQTEIPVEKVVDDPLTANVGTIELPILKPAKVKILDVELQPKKDGKLKLLTLQCKHPEKLEPIALSKIKVLDGEKLKTLSLWLHLDDNGQVQKGSSVALLLDFVKVANAKELEGKEIHTVKESEDSKYLAIKCYE